MGRQNDSIQQVKCLITIAIIDVEENDDNKALVLKDLKNTNG